MDSELNKTLTQISVNLGVIKNSLATFKENQEKQEERIKQIEEDQRAMAATLDKSQGAKEHLGYLVGLVGGLIGIISAIAWAATALGG